MILTNNEIYNYANALVSAFQDKEQRLPIRLNFFIQKNKATLINLAQEIEKSRMEIAQSYGELDTESNQYVIAPDKIVETQKELNDLFSLEQEVNIGVIKASCLSDDYNLSTAQMEAIMFMIDEEA